MLLTLISRCGRLGAAVLLLAAASRAGDALLPLEALPGLGGMAPGHPALADLDGDGRLDLVVAGSGTQQAPHDTIVAWRGLPGGRFTPLAEVDLPGDPFQQVTTFALLVADLDDDGTLDLLVSASSAASPGIKPWLARGTGDGQFSVPTPLENLLPGVKALAAADFDEDGQLDLLAGTPGDLPSTAHGNGDGSFAAPLPLPGAPSGSFLLSFVDARDLDDDGHADALVIDTHSLPPRATAWLGTGDGSFSTPRVTVLPGQSLSRPTVGFIDDDAWPDFIVAEGTQLHAFLGVGDGSFTGHDTTLSATATFGYQGTALGDFDGDGLTDALVVRPAMVLRGHGNGQFDPPVTEIPCHAFRALAADFDGNGRSDAVLVDGEKRLVSVVRDDGQGGLGAGTTLFVPSTVRDAEAGDFDQDGLLDVLTSGVVPGNLSMLFGQPDGSFVSSGLWSLNNVQLQDLEQGDLDGDGWLDAVDAGTAQPAGGYARGLLNDGTGALHTQDPLLVVPQGINNISLCDLDTDGLLDLLLVSDTNLRLVLGDGSGVFGAPSIFPVGGRDVQAGDVTGDGLADVVVAGPVPTLLAGDGTGALLPAVPLPSDGGNFIGALAALADVDADGATDIAMILGAGAGSEVPRLRVFLSQGDGAYVIRDTPDPGIGLGDFELADVSGDGLPDALEAEVTLTFALGLGDGRFGAWRATAGPFTVTDVDLADFDHDGRDEFLLAAGGADPVQKLLMVVPVTPTGPFAAVGHGSLGAHGVPVLTPEDFPDGVRLVLESARSSSPLLLVAGLQSSLLPAHGGTLVPSPDAVLAGLMTDPAGGLTLEARWPSGLPAGTSLLVQAWIADRTVAGGQAGSNGVLLVVE